MNSWKQPAWLSSLDVVAAIFFFIALIVVFFLTPVEAVMGPVQKVFYFHVSSAWVGMLGFFVAAITAGMYLYSRNFDMDMISDSAVEIGLVFILISIVSGSIWAKPIWNTWWTWDPRLTTSAIVVLVYLAYRMLRSSVDDPSRKARYSAVFAIAGFLSVPLTFFSIRLARTIHPVLIAPGGSASEGFSMSPAMQFAFVFSLAVFSILFVDLLCHRYFLAKIINAMEENASGEG